MVYNDTRLFSYNMWPGLRGETFFEILRLPELVEAVRMPFQIHTMSKLTMKAMSY